MAGAFRSGCIRGPYPDEWNSETAYRIGRYLPDLIGVHDFVIGRDARQSSTEIFEYLSKGLTDSGADVSDIGIVDTPALYFANVYYKFPGSIMITASHNPACDNGMKIHTGKAVPVSNRGGLDALEMLVAKAPDMPDARVKGSGGKLDIREDYIALLSEYREGISPLKVVIECMNGCAGAFIKDILRGLPGEYILLNVEPDGSFPAHGPNPLIPENTELLVKTVLEKKADIGICFDGDADRAIFIDEKGRMVSPDLILAYLARYYFVHFPEKMKGDDVIVYDLRCSSSVKEYVSKLGGSTVETGTGHTNMQNAILNNRGLIGCELAGHYYFRDFYGQDTAWIAVLMVLSIQSNENMKFSEIISDIDKHFFSGEINFKTKNPGEVFEFLEKKYSSEGGRPEGREGLKMIFPDWWFLVRTSNTEPVLRLVVEASSQADLDKKVLDVKGAIQCCNRFD